ncbi:hypothetical protein [Leptolyngbya sp. NK1-12]|uniref:hypothetical protein n=1 Tax=Leptolyngbya sp. NK1-12 TaxID=2547451 RepID=UPI00292F0CD3|nr:hypothetical protein [Leptolyngbya sp. NK1-12]
MSSPKLPVDQEVSRAKESAQSGLELSEQRVFRLSPLIRLTLLALYVALTLPLPFLAQATEAPVPPAVLLVGVVVGLIALYAALSERVIVDAQGIQVAYPGWVRWLWRKGWYLAWSDIEALKPRSTGQGGIVYYFLNHAGAAYLLPMRVAGFAELVRLVQAKTGIDTRDVRPLAQPWMYLFLLGLTVMLLAVDAWTIAVAANQL